MIDCYRLARPLLFRMDAEAAHGLAIRAARWRLFADGTPDDPVLETRLWGRRLANPLGLAAGFDKSATAVAGCLALGFSHVEVGSVTPRAQRGNPRPRLFRLEADRAVINRMGFNNDGAAAVRARLAAHRRHAEGSLVGVNLGKNFDSADAAADYAAGAAALAGVADYLVVNVSSPNTPGLRALQGPAALRSLLDRIGRALGDTGVQPRPPLLLKIAPDLTAEDRSDIARTVLEANLDGLIVSNTTIKRPDTLASPLGREQGGLSGRPLFEPSTALLAEMYTLTRGRLPLIGVGGVESGAHAYAKIRAGATLVQLYTALVYEGPRLVGLIKADLAARLRRDGFATIAEAVGADHR